MLASTFVGPRTESCFSQSLQVRKINCTSWSCKDWIGSLLFLALLSWNVSLGLTLEEMCQGDPKLELVRRSIPGGWKMVLQGDCLICLREKEVFTLMAPRTNAPFTSETPEEEKNRFETLGRKNVLKVVLRAEPKWSEKKLRETRERNDAVFKEMAGLIRKFHLEKLFDSPAARKGLENACSDDPQEKKSLEAYREKRTELEKRIEKLPDLDSEKYSLFMDPGEYDDDFHETYPREALEEWWRVKSLFEKTMETR